MHDVTYLRRSGKAVEFKDGIKIDIYDTRKRHKKNFIGCYPIRMIKTANELSFEMPYIKTLGISWKDR